MSDKLRTIIELALQAAESEALKSNAIPGYSLMADAVASALKAHDIVPVYRHQLEAFAANCVHHGDMTPAGKVMLERILEGEQ